MTLARHMPYAQSSEKIAEVHTERRGGGFKKKTKKTSTEVSEYFFVLLLLICCYFRGSVQLILMMQLTVPAPLRVHTLFTLMCFIK